MKRLYKMTFDIAGAKLTFNVVSPDIKAALTVGERLCRENVSGNYQDKVEGSCVEITSSKIDELIEVN